MSIIAVDTEVMSLNSQRVQTTRDRIAADVKAMHLGLAELQGTWRGSAAVNFQTIINEWVATQRRVEANLLAITHALAQSASQYQQVEQLNAQRFLH